MRAFAPGYCGRVLSESVQNAHSFNLHVICIDQPPGSRQIWGILSLCLADAIH